MATKKSGAISKPKSADEALKIGKIDELSEDMEMSVDLSGEMDLEEALSSHTLKEADLKKLEQEVQDALDSDDDDITSATGDDIADGHDVTNDAVRDYLKKVSEEAMMTFADEKECSDRSQLAFFAEWKLKNSKITSEKKITELEWLVQDGRRARHQLVQSNLRLVVALARTYTGRGVAFPDLVTVGNDGLVYAALGYDASRGFHFSTYATWWVRQSILRGIMNMEGFRRVPVHMRETMQKTRQAIRQLSDHLHREPTIDEVAQAIGATIAKTREVLQFIKESTPVSQVVNDDDGKSRSIEETIPDDEPDKTDLVTQGAALDALREVLNTLTEKERNVIELRVGIYDGQKKSLEEVGRLLSCTRERVRQIEKRALAKVSHPARRNIVSDYLGDNVDMLTLKDPEPVLTPSQKRALRRKERAEKAAEEAIRAEKEAKEAAEETARLNAEVAAKLARVHRKAESFKIADAAKGLKKVKPSAEMRAKSSAMSESKKMVAKKPTPSTAVSKVPAK